MHAGSIDEPFLSMLCIFSSLLLSADFVQKYFFSKNYFRNTSECQTVWIQIRTTILSIFIWVQTVCNCYEQTTKTSLARKGLKGTKITGERFLMLWAYIIFLVHTVRTLMRCHILWVYNICKSSCLWERAVWKL